MAMEWTDVASSQLSAIGYDAETLKAQVRFSNGALYEYEAVPVDVVPSIIGAESVGRAFNSLLKFGYTYKKLE